ncbi:putative vegetative incompatibility protein HET-E-1 [Rosellinia necatrix]|uniref:Putative vegetative incompatibility protein HET-E-1 n=1 Tax=Rosellinia necatrix TaxID=77044 RepID=A0A1S8A965_ROSNE|nr:putative vegetative incompatibility protein HET-E-1 [Rosellinia necatrix]
MGMSLFYPASDTESHFFSFLPRLPTTLATIMDPISAVGVAAAAVQFLGATINAHNIFQDIRSSKKSNTEQNKQLEKNVRAARDLRVGLRPSPTPQGAGDPVSTLTADCESKAKELLELLEYVRGEGETIKPFLATIRVLRKKKRIEQLYASLKEDQDTLNQMIHQKLLPSIDHLTVLQTKEFASLNSIAQALIRELVEQRRIQADNAAKLGNVHSDMQLYFNGAERSKAREELLKSLWFPYINQRYDRIEKAVPMTLNWLFQAPMEYARGGEWSDFTQWLREDTSMYWISGKAGSGKSTLMAHIVNDERTRKNLEVWSGNHTLQILSFFFWRAGSEYQRNIPGLLRSLLHQLCSSRSTTADAVIARLPSPLTIPAWTDRSLRDHITEAIRSDQDRRFCIFIDGLDEYMDGNGTLSGLVDDLNNLQKLGNIKLCVSSRPELELVSRLKGLKQLCLHNLNRGDIQEFVQQSFEKTPLSTGDRSYFTEEVVKRADGVFLWASFVALDLVKGANAFDSRTIMEERLASLPQDMDKLFENMLSKNRM